MVSTRGVRYKFSEGERVLCYEPDPTKAKVLYDSKVLEVIENKDKRGRRSFEYLIHFQGWNSSWDRCVSEDFVLKDTEENRQLQRDLAEKSQLQLGAYLYRRERKKGSSSTIGPGTAKRPRLGFSDDGSSSSTQPEAEAGDTDSSSGDGSGSQSHSPPPATPGRAQIPLPTALRDRLTFDYHLVVKRGRLSRLPASPCAAQILESFVKWFARAGAWHPARARHDPPQRPDLLDVSCRLNLVREVADGMRVYFDFVLRGHLLYKQEHQQYHEMCGKYADMEEVARTNTCEEQRRPEGEEASRPEGEQPQRSEGDEHKRPEFEEPRPPELEELKFPESEELKYLEAESLTPKQMEIKSPKLPEYSHLPPDPFDDEKKRGRRGCKKSMNDREFLSFRKVKMRKYSGASSSTQGNSSVAIKSEPIDKTIVKTEPVSEQAASNTPENPNLSQPSGSIAKPKEVRSAMRSGGLARRLRSHKSAVSQSENEEPAPSTSTGEPRTFETLSSSIGSSGSSLSESWARPTQSTTAPSTTRTPLSLLLDKVAKWQIIPREGTDHLPCRVYGAIHLARLFVKLPEFLNTSSMPDFKLKLILKHIDMFVQYLDEHTEWFGEACYISDAVSRSH